MAKISAHNGNGWLAGLWRLGIVVRGVAETYKWLLWLSRII